MSDTAASRRDYDLAQRVAEAIRDMADACGFAAAAYVALTTIEALRPETEEGDR